MGGGSTVKATRNCIECNKEFKLTKDEILAIVQREEEGRLRCRAHENQRKREAMEAERQLLNTPCTGCGNLLCDNEIRVGEGQCWNCRYPPQVHQDILMWTKLYAGRYQSERSPISGLQYEILKNQTTDDWMLKVSFSIARPFEYETCLPTLAEAKTYAEKELETQYEEMKKAYDATSGDLNTHRWARQEHQRLEKVKREHDVKGIEAKVVGHQVVLDLLYDEGIFQYRLSGEEGHNLALQLLSMSIAACRREREDDEDGKESV
jgi:hypothetical protein